MYICQNVLDEITYVMRMSYLIFSCVNEFSAVKTWMSFESLRMVRAETITLQ